MTVQPTDANARSGYYVKSLRTTMCRRVWHINYVTNVMNYRLENIEFDLKTKRKPF